ncbi:CPBP family intramembrane glutamic endopeptidase [Microbacterium sp. gxy059]|uniref:CPBP family intramembrane glutamic endopeptidase n=1 Tax=Microbacterium sp. gxy059 TaxID=2957199 RepID=UPI003D98E84E
MNATSLFSPHDVRPGLPPARVPWGGVIAYLAIAAVLGWIVCLPLWMGDGLRDPAFQLYAAGLMYTPTVAALVVVFASVPKGARARYLGLLPFRPIARKLWMFALLPVGFLATGFASFFLAVALGWTSVADLAPVAAALPPAMNLDAWIAMQFLLLPLIILQATVAAFGEELGWRGYLTTALSPLGFWPSAVIIGIVWGLWHAPIILLGYNFQRTDGWGLALMCGFTFFVGVLLQWTRYVTRSVWPAAVGHGALNATLPLTLIWTDPETDVALGTGLGVAGWIVFAVVIAVLLVTRSFRPAPDWTPKVDVMTPPPAGFSYPPER